MLCLFVGEALVRADKKTVFHDVVGNRKMRDGLSMLYVLERWLAENGASKNWSRLEDRKSTRLNSSH